MQFMNAAAIVIAVLPMHTLAQEQPTPRPAVAAITDQARAVSDTLRAAGTDLVWAPFDGNPVNVALAGIGSQIAVSFAADVIGCPQAAADVAAVLDVALDIAQ